MVSAPLAGMDGDACGEAVETKSARARMGALKSPFNEAWLGHVWPMGHGRTRWEPHEPGIAPIVISLNSPSKPLSPTLRCLRPNLFRQVQLRATTTSAPLHLLQLDTSPIWSIDSSSSSLNLSASPQPHPSHLWAIHIHTSDLPLPSHRSTLRPPSAPHICSSQVRPSHIFSALLPISHSSSPTSRSQCRPP